MKTYKIQLTPRAQASITRIVSQLEVEASKSVANKVYRGLMDTIRRLKTLPESHQVFEEISDEQIVFRRVLKWDYKIVFTVNNELLEVIVVQVYHGARGSQWVNSQFKT